MKDLVSILEILVIFLQTIKENKILVALQTYHQTEYPKFLKILVGEARTKRAMKI
jgi:hypothetical protein